MATYNKANNTTNLNLTGSWATSIVPTSTDIAQWEATVAGANATVLGANLSWLGIIIANPGGAITINSGNTLTIGSSAIVMSAATQDFTINCALALGANNSWNPQGGRTLRVTSVISGAYNLARTNYGAIYLDNAANTYSGTTTVNQGFFYIKNLANGGSNSPIGASSNAAANLVIDGGYLYCVQTAAASTDRLFTLTANGGGFYCEGGYNLTFTNTGAIAFSGSGSRGLYFNGTGSTTQVDCLLGDPSGGTLTLGGGEGGIRKLTAMNTYTGATNIGYQWIVTNIANGGAASNIGQSTNAASNLIFAYSGANIIYIGAEASTDRLFSISSDMFMTYQQITASGTGALTWSNAGAITYNGDPGIATLPWRLGGTNTDYNTFTPVFSDYNGTTRKLSFEKVDAGTWILAGANTYTSTTTVTAGTLYVDGSTAAGSAVSVASGAYLGGIGTIAGSITLGAGSIFLAGSIYTGHLTTGAVTFNATSTFECWLWSVDKTHGTITSTGAVACAGTLSVMSAFGVPAYGDIYDIITASSVTGTFSGLANNATFSAQGRTFRINYTATKVILTDINTSAVYSDRAFSRGVGVGIGVGFDRPF